MLVFVRVGITVCSVLQLQEVRLRHVQSPTAEVVGVLFLVGNTCKQVEVMLTERAVIVQGILCKEVGVFAVSLGQTLIVL